MSNISAADVNKLRQISGAGMMDCKKALTEADGDFEKAIDILRKKGQKVAANRADKTSSEGAVFAKTTADSSRGVIFSLNCETDFVAKTDDFMGLGTQIAAAALAANAQDAETVLGLTLDGGRKVADHLTDLMGKIGEKIEINRFQNVAAEKVVPYIHAGAKLGVLVALSNTSGLSDFETPGKDVGMQVAAMNPVAVDKDQVDPTLVQRELEIGRERALAEGKPANILDKIAQGYVNKFYQENTLLNQTFVKVPNQTVSAYLQSLHKGLTVKHFARVAVNG